jgi:hypothetical protein
MVSEKMESSYHVSRKTEMLTNSIFSETFSYHVCYDFK